MPFDALRAEIRAGMASGEPHADPKPFIWTKSPGQILENVARAKQSVRVTTLAASDPLPRLNVAAEVIENGLPAFALLLDGMR
jgi:hypothetical protein